MTIQLDIANTIADMSKALHTTDIPENEIPIVLGTTMATLLALRMERR